MEIAFSTNEKQQDKIVYTVSGAWLWWGSGIGNSPTALLIQMLCAQYGNLVGCAIFNPLRKYFRVDSALQTPSDSDDISSMTL